MYINRDGAMACAGSEFSMQDCRSILLKFSLDWIGKSLCGFRTVGQGLGDLPTASHIVTCGHPSV